jgi:hypothetical protein
MRSLGAPSPGGRRWPRSGRMRGSGLSGKTATPHPGAFRADPLPQGEGLRSPLTSSAPPPPAAACLPSIRGRRRPRWRCR